MHRWKLIDEALGLARAKPAETYSTSDHLFTELGIPLSATGTLPRALRSRAGLDAEAVEDIGETGRKAVAGAKDSPGRGGRSRGRRSAGPPGSDGRKPADGGGGEPPRERTRTRRRTRGGRDTQPPARRRRTPPSTSTNRRRAAVSRPGAPRPAKARSAVPGPGGGGPGAACQRPDRHHFVAPPGSPGRQATAIPVPVRVIQWHQRRSPHVYPAWASAVLGKGSHGEHTHVPHPA